MDKFEKQIDGAISNLATMLNSLVDSVAKVIPNIDTRDAILLPRACMKLVNERRISDAPPHRFSAGS